MEPNRGLDDTVMRSTEGGGVPPAIILTLTASRLACSLSATFLGSNICSCSVTPQLVRANKIPTAWLSRHQRSYLLALPVLTEP